MDAYKRNKLHWKCRRGLLELDLVLEKFLPRVNDSDVGPLEELLDQPDNDLWDIVIGRSDAFPPHLNAIVARLRAT